ncbi:MAG: class I SAM-dependent methyltransferase [Akkermansiaceae bacterium]
MKHTREPQYQSCLEIKERKGAASLGLRGTQLWTDDPKHVLFSLSRYKFVAKMFSGFRNALEIGCGDAMGTRLVQQEVGSVTVVDFDPVFIEDVKDRIDPDWPLQAYVHDIVEGPVSGVFEGIYALDVLEHIPAADEASFIRNATSSLSSHGCMILGMPSLESQSYASPGSKAGHVNCKTASDFKKLMKLYFHQVFVFSMNDEVLHTGFHPMAHYIFALCCDLKGQPLPR